MTDSPLPPVDTALLRFLQDLSDSVRRLILFQIGCAIVGLCLTLVIGWLMVRNVQSVALMVQQSQTLVKEVAAIAQDVHASAERNEALTRELLRRSPAP
jgi:hypothetical protein